MKIARFFLIALALTFSVATESDARNTNHTFPVAHALDTGTAKKAIKKDIRLFMAGRKHQKIIKDLGVYRSNKKTRGFGRSDHNSCDVAFLSALKTFQERARKEGGNAVVDIKSITRNNELTSSTEYGCLAGAIIVHVALEGRVVTMK